MVNDTNFKIRIGMFGRPEVSVAQLRDHEGGGGTVLTTKSVPGRGGGYLEKFIGCNRIAKVAVIGLLLVIGQ